MDETGLRAPSGVAAPRAGICFRRVDALAVDRDSRIAAQIFRAARAGHHPQAELPFVEVDFGSGDARCSVVAERRHGVVLARTEERRYARRELRGGIEEILPARHETSIKLVRARRLSISYATAPRARPGATRPLRRRQN